MDWIQHGLWPWLQSNGWLWAERLSWLVAIVGIPSLLFGLLAMGRRPKLAVGLTPLQKKRRLLRRAIELPASEATRSPAAMHNLGFAITNIGRATARELLVNHIFHGLSAQQLTVRPGAPPIHDHPLHGEPFWVIHVDHIHPGDSAFYELAAQVPTATQAIEIGYEVSMADAQTLRGTLRVKFG